MREMVVYAVLRLALFGVIWWLLTLAGVGVMLAGVLAALISMLLSILFLDKVRDRAAMRWKAADDRRRERRGLVVDEDAQEEDALLDAEQSTDQGSEDQARQ
ncbi:DUF4229 domain-containing protein [Brachybacterium muris]|uniref:DUF4229 domain-containing protein n=1 Tax=Brachybacterium muris UCD-AY4 TaxID=1249481 RepID=A0A022KXM4_9MICO|nr:DUF4229 domain-containing protein [Brachybacterium muris]EYT51045.1 hypothetical protein D641_0100830 [Brachybacterium muris UCD-AY4]MCT1654145.1 DUF4229 domain-containing protein [Brachybacterium muris]